MQTDTLHKVLLLYTYILDKSIFFLVLEGGSSHIMKLSSFIQFLDLDIGS